MSYEVNFTIPGKVQAKQRPKFNRFSGKAYTPKQTISYENWVRECYMNAIKGKTFSKETTIYDKPLSVEIKAYFEVPKSESQKKKKQMLSGEIRPMIKPDCDNIAKSILDGLNNIAYADDKQVVSLGVKKYYNDKAYVVVVIQDI